LTSASASDHYFVERIFQALRQVGWMVSPTSGG
jgi:hypothetical protein